MPIKDLLLGAQRDELKVVLKFLQGSFFFPGMWGECASEDTLRKFVTLKAPFISFYLENLHKHHQGGTLALFA